MRVDLLIESEAPSTAAWTAMAQSLLQRAPHNPPFSLLLSGGLRADGAPGREIRLALCTTAADIAAVMALVFAGIESAAQASGAPFTVRLDAGPVLVAGRLLADFQTHAAAAIAAARTREGDGLLATADDVRQLFNRVTGTTHTGIVRHESEKNPPGYSLAVASGRQLFAMPSPIGRGWFVIERAANGDVLRTWTTAPQYQHFGLCLQLGHYLADIAPPLDPVFSHAPIEADAKPHRNHFSSAIGPLVIHSRELGPDRSQLQVVIEIPQRAEIRSYTVPRGTLPQQYELVPAVPF